MFNHQTKRWNKTHLLRSIMLLTLGCGFAAIAMAQSDSLAKTVTEVTVTKTKYKPNYWYLGAEFFSPFMYDDLYSWTRETGGKFHFGTGVQLKGGYQFTSVFAVEASLGVGRNRLSASDFQNNFYLGRNDAYTYYPYTLIQGTVYTNPFPDLVGEQGRNFTKVVLEGTSFQYIESRVQFLQASVGAVVNVTRLFYPGFYREKPVEVLVRPGIYLSRFRSEVVDVRTGKVVAPRINRARTWGAGSDLTMRFNLTPRWAIDLTGRFVWERDHTMDGVNNIKRAYDAYMVQPGLAVVYKFRKPSPVRPMPTMPEALPPVFPELDCWYPEALLTNAPKQRSHTAAIYLTYPLNKTYIDKNLHNNPDELARLDRELDSYIGHEDYTVRRIRVEGFASPEGPYMNNMRLAEGRARSIINYIVSKKPMLQRSMFEVGRMTENWDGLRDTLQRNASLPGRDAFLALLDKEPDTERVKQNIKRIPQYKNLLDNVYPRLRLSSYTVEYDVRAYDIVDARRVIEHNPELLSAEEMYAVAVDYGLGTPQGERIIGILAKYYPEADLTLTYQGVALLKQKAYEKAIATLEKVQRKQGLANNALGVAHANLKNTDNAIEYFERASLDNRDARENLARLKRYLRQVNNR